MYHLSNTSIFKTILYTKQSTYSNVTVLTFKDTIFEDNFRLLLEYF